MPTPKSHRRGQEEKDRKVRLTEKSSSFHGRIPETVTGKLHRPLTVPELLSGQTFARHTPEPRPKLTKLLLNVTIQRSLGPVMLVMSPESTVGDLIAAALRQYAKEGRRPILPSSDASGFDLHYSQFSLESLDRDEKLTELGSRNFFMCPKKNAIENCGEGFGSAVTSSSCSKQADKRSKIGVPWLKFMDFLF